MAEQFMIQRQFPRFPLQLPVLFRCQGEQEGPRAGVGTTRDLSEGGVCLELDYRYPVGTTLSLIIQGEGTNVEATARVAWAGQPSPEGHIPHGMQFAELTPEQQEGLRKLLPQGGFVRRGSVRVPVELEARCQPALGTGDPLIGRTADISRRGAQVILSQLLPVMSEVSITLCTPTGEIRQRAQVRWAAPTEGEQFRHGLQFLEINWEADAFLSQLLAAGRADNAPPPP